MEKTSDIVLRILKNKLTDIEYLFNNYTDEIEEIIKKDDRLFYHIGEIHNLLFDNVKIE